MLERNSSSVFSGFFLTGLTTRATNAALFPQLHFVPQTPGPLKLPQSDLLGREFFDFQGRNVACVHWAGQPTSDAIRELRTSLESFWDGLADGSMFDLDADVRAAAERIGALYPNLFKLTAV